MNTLTQSLKYLGFATLALAAVGCSSMENSFKKSGDTLERVTTAVVGKMSSYQCSDKKTYSVRYYDSGESNLAEIRLPNGKIYTLAQVISGSGAKYVGDIYEWWSKGDTAYFTDLMADPDQSLECKIKS